MKLIRFCIRGLITWSLLLLLLGGAIAASPRARQDVLGLLLLAIIGGALGCLYFRRTPAAAPHDEAQPDVVSDAVAPIPGVRGARAALADRSPDQAPETLAVTYQGQLKAYVTRDAWHPTDLIAQLPADDPDYRLVAMMSVYAQSVLVTPGATYTEQDAIAYALAQMLPHELIERDLPDPASTARALAIPVGVLTAENLRMVRQVITAHTTPDATPNPQ